MKDRHFTAKLLATALALFTSMLLAGAVQAQGKPAAADAQLDKVHATEGVGCVKCHTGTQRSQPVATATCVGCHEDGSTKALAAKTSKVTPTNPHDNRHYGTDADCNLCHRVHEKSVNYCLDCHGRFDFKVK